MAIIRLEIDAGVSVQGEGALRLVADVHLPPVEVLGAQPLLLFCLPGGAMSRRYFDLLPDANGRDISFSFARQMTARGYIVVSVDHLGVGESSRPADGYALTHELVTQANANVYGQLVARLRDGTLQAGYPPLPGLRSIGVGHSMGAMMTVLQQAAFKQHVAVALLGFSTRGMPDYVPPEVKALASDTAAIRARLPEFARKLFVVPYPQVRSSSQSSSMFEGGAADPTGVQAIKSARDVMPPVLAFMSMVPGNVAPEAGQIDTPVFLGVGEKDIAGRPHQIPAAFTASQDVSLYIQPGAGHSHFLFASRTALYDRFATWVNSIVR